MRQRNKDEKIARERDNIPGSSGSFPRNLKVSFGICTRSYRNTLFTYFRTEAGNTISSPGAQTLSGIHSFRINPRESGGSPLSSPEVRLVLSPSGAEKPAETPFWKAASLVCVNVAQDHCVCLLCQISPMVQQLQRVHSVFIVLCNHYQPVTPSRVCCVIRVPQAARNLPLQSQVSQYSNWGESSCTGSVFSEALTVFRCDLVVTNNMFTCLNKEGCSFVTRTSCREFTRWWWDHRRPARNIIIIEQILMGGGLQDHKQELQQLQ